MDDFYQNPEFGTLEEEFNKIIEFKNISPKHPLSDIENLLKD